MSSWWADPMPPGWEAKWDPGQNRYFFIDHTTKKTSWVDPRSPEGRHQVRPQPQPRAPYGGAIPMQSMTVPCSQCRINKVPQTPVGQICASCKAQRSQIKCVKCLKTVVKQRGDTCTECVLQNLLTMQETSFMHQSSTDEEGEELAGLFTRADEALVKKLKGSYPDAMESHVRSALESNDNNEASACRDLEKRGYKKVSAQEVKAEKLCVKLKRRYPECPKDLLFSTIIGCDCGEMATLKKLKELGFLTQDEKQEKERKERQAKQQRTTVEQNVRRDFSHLSSDVITMMLEASNYDDAKTRTLLKSMYSDTPAAAAAAPSTSRPATSATASKPSPSSGKQPANPKASPRKTTPTIVQQPRPATTAAASPPKSATKVAVKQPAAAKVLKNTSAARRMHASKLAQGPDHSLPKGANGDILLTGYCDVMGPNSDLVNGRTCKVMGSQGAVGADYSLVRGPARYAIAV